MATLETLRKRVLIRLGDFKLTRDLEADHYLNEAQDKFTRETMALRLTDIQDVASGTASYTVAAPEGYIPIEIIQAIYYDGSTDTLLAHKTLGEMTLFSENWRNDSGDPRRYIRNYDAGVSADSAAPSVNQIYLHPKPNAEKTGGLRIVYAAMTDTAMTTDASTSKLPKYDDALVDYALSQMGHPEAQQRMANFMAAVESVRADVARGFDEAPKRVVPNTGR